MLLSVIIPSYNHEQFILSTIKAAVNIDIQNKEIIVIDDGSSDASIRVIRDYIADKDASYNIKFVARENRGLVKTLNEGLSIAKGKYLYLVASDDIPIPEGIVSLVNILETDRGLQFVMGNALVMYSEQQREFTPTYGENHRRFFALPWDKRHKEMFLNYPQPILLQATVFKTSTLNAIGGWREDIVVDDFSLFLRMFSRFHDVGQDFGFHPEIMACFYRQHQTNSFRNIERQFMMVEQALTQLCPAEWRDEAIFRNFRIHGVGALREGRLLLASQFLLSTVTRIGLARSMPISAVEFCKALIAKLSKNHAKKFESLVIHEPAAATISHSRKAPE